MCTHVCLWPPGGTQGTSEPLTRLPEGARVCVGGGADNRTNQNIPTEQAFTKSSRWQAGQLRERRQVHDLFENVEDGDFGSGKAPRGPTWNSVSLHRPKPKTCCDRMETEVTRVTARPPREQEAARIRLCLDRNQSCRTRCNYFGTLESVCMLVTSRGRRG